MALFQICAVLGTLSLIAIAVAHVAALLTMRGLAEDLAKSAESIRTTFARIEGIATHEFQQLTHSVQEIMPSVRRVTSRFEHLGDRTADLSDAVLTEVEAPVRTAVALARGIRTGTTQLFRNLTRRAAHSQAITNGGQDHA
jgi:uncharacterized protein YoxC